MSDVILQTPRLLLRRWRPSDLAPFAAMNADPAVMRYFPAPLTAEQTAQLYEIAQREFAERGYTMYAAEERRSGDFMGFIGFHAATLDTDFCPCVEIGWRLAERFWNRGYATEGARACLRHGFGALGFERVYSFTAQLNLPSQRVMQKIGMRRDRSFDHPALPDGHPLRPHVLYVIDAEGAMPAD